MYRNSCTRNWMMIMDLVMTFSFVAAHIGKIFGPFGPSNWHTAKSTCEGQGRKLLTIDSQDEEDVFRALADITNRYVTMRNLSIPPSPITCTSLLIKQLRSHVDRQEVVVERPEVSLRNPLNPVTKQASKGSSLAGEMFP